MRLIAFFVFCLFPAFGFAASEVDSVRHFFVTSKVEHGKVFQTNEFFKGENAQQKSVNSFSAFTLGVGWQTSDDGFWQGRHRFPALGIAVSTTRFNYSSEIGQPVSLFGFYRGVFARRGEIPRHAFRYNIDLGLAFRWKYYNKNTNPYNIAIGSPATVHVGLGLEYEYTLSDHFSLSFGGAFTHFSNGAIRKPNKGANLFSPFVRLTYYPRPYKPNCQYGFGYGNNPLCEARSKANEIQVTAAFAFKRVEHNLVAHPSLDTKYEDKPVFYVYTLKIGYLRQYSSKGKWGGGLNVCYDQWFGSDIRVSPEGHITKDLSHCPNKPNLGLYATHEFLIGNFAVLTDLGTYIYQPPTPWKEQKKDPVFERLGAKYYLPFNINVGVNVYAHNSKADFVEWCMGYRFRWSRWFVACATPRYF